MKKRIIPMVVAGLMIVFLLPLVVFADVSYEKKAAQPLMCWALTE